MIRNDTPILGKWKKKITRLDKMALVDCVPNAFAMVLGSAVGLFHVFWALNGPECVDNAYDRLRAGGKPQPPNTPGTGRGKHRGFYWRGSAVGPAGGPAPGSYGATMIPIGDAAQKVGLVLGIVDGFLNGVFYGATLARRYSGCDTPFQPYVQAYMLNQVPILLPAFEGWLGQWQLAARNILLSSPISVGFPPGVSSFITVMLNIQQGFNEFPPLPDCQFSYEMRWYPSGDPVRQNWGGIAYTQDGSGVLFGQDVLRHPTDVELRVWCRKTFGVLFITRGDWTVYAGNLAGGLSPYECKAKTSLPE